MKRFSEKMLISTRCMSNLITKSWTDSIAEVCAWKMSGTYGMCLRSIVGAIGKHFGIELVRSFWEAFGKRLGQSMIEDVFLTLGRSRSSHLKQLGLRPKA